MRRNKEQERIRGKRYYRTIKGKYHTYKGGAKKRGFMFNMSLQEFTDIINKPCSYCGREGFGIDRTDSTKGYIKDNIVPCCTQCNYMKLNYTVEEFISKCKEIVNYSTTNTNISGQKVN